MKTFETLASLDFGSILAEAIRDNKTQTGRELLEKYSAVLMNYLGRQMIADHAHQGFSVIRSCGAGSVGTFCGRTIVCASSYQGTNTGYGIMLDDGRWADEVYDGTYIMYTCNDASGVSVTVTFWN